MFPFFQDLHKYSRGRQFCYLTLAPVGGLVDILFTRMYSVFFHQWINVPLTFICTRSNQPLTEKFGKSPYLPSCTFKSNFVSRSPHIPDDLYLWEICSRMRLWSFDDTLRWKSIIYIWGCLLSRMHSPQKGSFTGNLSRWSCWYFSILERHAWIKSKKNFPIERIK